MSMERVESQRGTLFYKNYMLVPSNNVIINFLACIELVI